MIFKYFGYFDLSSVRWDEKKKLFVNIETGKTYTARQMRALIDEMSENLIETYSTGLPETPDIERLYKDFWDGFLIGVLDSFLLGSGGQFTSETKSFVEIILAEQLGYYQRFGTQILSGQLSLAQIKDRFRMYASALRGVYERGRVYAYSPTLVLPAYPGQVQCGNNCKCFLNIREFSDRWEVRWVRTARESCSDCIQYGASWQPYTVYK